MKKIFFKKIGATILSLSLIFSISSKVCFAADIVANITNVTPKFTFDISNDGLMQGDKVNGKLKVQFNSSDTDATHFNMKSFDVYIFVDYDRYDEKNQTATDFILEPVVNDDGMSCLELGNSFSLKSVDCPLWLQNQFVPIIHVNMLALDKEQKLELNKEYGVAEFTFKLSKDISYEKLENFVYFDILEKISEGANSLTSAIKDGNNNSMSLGTSEPIKTNSICYRLKEPVRVYELTHTCNAEKYEDKKDGAHHMAVCDICKKQKEEEHKWVPTANNIDVNNKCYEIKTDAKCSLCDMVPVEHIFEATADHVLQWINLGNNTCKQVCQNSGCTHVETAAQEHAWEEVTDGTKEPTCVKDGEKKYKCKNCETEKTEVIPAKKHDYSKEEKIEGNDEQHKLVCSVCGDDSNNQLEDHQWEKVDGDKVCNAKCSACGYEYIKDSHSYVDEEISATDTQLGGKKQTCSFCGDTILELNADDSKDLNTQIEMPDGTSIFEYSEDKGLCAEQNVDLGDGKNINIFVADPFDVLESAGTGLSLEVEHCKPGSAEYEKYMKNYKGKYDIEHLMLFDVTPKVNGTDQSGALDGKVYMSFEIPEDWDADEIEIALIDDNGNLVEFTEFLTDENGKKYVALWNDHFSPFVVIDKLTEADKATPAAPVGSTNVAQPSTEQKETVSGQTKTGDASYAMIMTALLSLLLAGLYIGFSVRRKRD